MKWLFNSSPNYLIVSASSYLWDTPKGTPPDPNTSVILTLSLSALTACIGHDAARWWVLAATNLHETTRACAGDGAPNDLPPWVQRRDLLPGYELSFALLVGFLFKLFIQASHESFLNAPTGFCFWLLLSTAHTSPRNLVGWEATPDILIFLLAAASVLLRTSPCSYRTEVSRCMNGTDWYGAEEYGQWGGGRDWFKLAKTSKTCPIKHNI